MVVKIGDNCRLVCGDCLDVMRGMKSNSINCCVTSPPYWFCRDYDVVGQIGLELTIEEYIEKLVLVFDEVKRVLRSDGVLWLNMGDIYYSSFGGGTHGCTTGNKKLLQKRGSRNKPKHKVLKSKDLCLLPARVVIAMQLKGWYVRQDIVWSKNNPVPESVKDRCTKSHEYIYLLSKKAKYYYDYKAIREIANSKKYKTRNKRSVWVTNTASSSKLLKGAANHPAMFPEELIEPCILVGCPKGGVVFDPFMGSGTTGLVSLKHDRKFVGIELNQSYVNMSAKRLSAFA